MLMHCLPRKKQLDKCLLDKHLPQLQDIADYFLGTHASGYNRLLKRIRESFHLMNLIGTGEEEKR